MESVYTVTESDRKLWAVCLDLLDKFKEVCRKYDLTYYAACGTLLGAARHKGFIPWDDDVDLYMMWPDYQKLMEIGPKEFKEPYFYQDQFTSKYSCCGHAKIRRSDTTGAGRWEYEQILDPSFNKGIFIDIFPLFAIPDSEEDKKAMMEEVMWYWTLIKGYEALQSKEVGDIIVNPSFYDYIPRYLEASKTLDIKGIKRKYFEACARYEGPTEEVGCTSFRTLNPKFMARREWYGETTEMPFENTTICCPVQYDELLTAMYGDWRTPLYNGSIHVMTIMDPDVPYKEAIKQLQGVK